MAIAQLSVSWFGWNFGGWSGRSYIPFPPSGTLIGHQGALLECKRCFFSAVCGPIWLKLWWMVGVGHCYHATRWRPDHQADGAPGGQRVLFQECWFYASEASNVFQERWMSEQREWWADDACLRVRFCLSKMSSVCRKRWMSEQREWWADDACHGWFCASEASSVAASRALSASHK